MASRCGRNPGHWLGRQGVESVEGRRYGVEACVSLRCMAALRRSPGLARARRVIGTEGADATAGAVDLEAPFCPLLVDQRFQRRPAELAACLPDW